MGDSFNQVASSIAFVDIATFDELEGFLYGGLTAVTYFVASAQKGNWFSMVDISLRSVGNAPGFGCKKSPFALTRQADYAINATTRAKFPFIGFKSALLQTVGPTVCWVKNVMHNLIRHTQLEFNDLCVEEFDCFWLDVNDQFRTVGEKRVIYDNMIGNTVSYTNPVSPGGYVGGTTLRCPLPYFFAEDSGFALPVAALPFNEVKINYDLRDWKELVKVDPGGANVDITDITTYVNGVPDDSQAPHLQCVETWVHYGVVHNDERMRMGEGPRDILMTQIQTVQPQPFKDVTTKSSFDIRLSHAIMTWFHLAQNVSLQTQFGGIYGADQSNYTCLSSVLSGPLANFPSDPLSYTVLQYENQSRFADNSGYYSLDVPWYFSTAGPVATGYHMASYALQAWNATSPCGSTEFSKLANVSITHTCSKDAIYASQGLYKDGATQILWPAGAEDPFKQSFAHIFLARNWNIGRVANGSFGFPALG